jgi:hypothetical protein
MAEHSDTKFINTAAQCFLSTNIALEVRVTSCEPFIIFAVSLCFSRMKGICRRHNSREKENFGILRSVTLHITKLMFPKTGYRYGISSHVNYLLKLT